MSSGDEAARTGLTDRARRRGRGFSRSRLARTLSDTTSPIWVLIETAAGALFSLVSMLVVSRSIGPEAAGIGAVALAAFLLLDLFGATMLTDAVLQWQKLEPRHAHSAATASVLVGLVASVALILTGFLIGWLTGHRQIPVLTAALAPLLPLSAYSGLLAGLALRQQFYRLLALRVLIGQPLGLALGLGAAHQHAGPWAMVLLQAGNTVSVFLLFLLSGFFRFRPLLDRPALRDLWPVAGPQLLAVVMQTGRYRFFVMALGTIATESVVALSNVGFRLIDAALAAVQGVTLRITLPRLAALQEDRVALVEAYGETAQLQALMAWPIAAGVALTAPDLVAGVMGPEWTSAAQGTRIAAVAAMFAYVYGDANSLWIALGKTRINLILSAAALAIPVAMLLAFRPGTPAGAAICWGAANLCLAPVNIYLVTRDLGRSPFWLLRRLLPSATGLAAMVAAILLLRPWLPAAPLPALCCQGVIGAGVFGLTSWLTLGRRMPEALRRTAPPADGIGSALGERTA